MLRLFKSIGHATQMMVKNMRNYFMLSLTVVLSFAVLLAYLCYTDSDLYNKYKELFSKPAQLVVVQDSGDSELAVESLIQLASLGDASHYIMTRMIGVTYDYEGLNVTTNVFSVPTVSWGLYSENDMMPLQVTWLDGRTESYVALGEGEVIVSRNFYELYRLDRQENPVVPVGIVLGFKNGAKQVSWMECRVVGTMDTETSHSATEIDEDGRVCLWSAIYLSQQTAQKILGGATAQYSNRSVIFYSETPEIVVEAANEVGMSSLSVSRLQNRAKEEMQVHAQTKMLVVVLLFVLLCINLFGSFSNALERRRFEVGVKRAIGAPRAAIIGQFFWESMLLMLCNVCAAILIVFNLFLVYKYIYQANNPGEWTIYINGTSTALFCIVSLALSLLFSGIFSLKATQVQVVDYLKAE